MRPWTASSASKNRSARSRKGSRATIVATAMIENGRRLALSEAGRFLSVRFEGLVLSEAAEPRSGRVEGGTAVLWPANGFRSADGGSARGGEARARRR